MLEVIQSLLVWVVVFQRSHQQVSGLAVEIKCKQMYCRGTVPYTKVCAW